MTTPSPKPTAPIVSPEWVVANRADRVIDPTILRGWETIVTPLHRGASYTDFSSHEIAVPAGESPQAQAVRLHELIHARISPPSVPAALMTQLGVTPLAVRIAEEIRVNYVAGCAHSRNSAIANIALMSDGSEKGLADEAVKNKDWHSALTLLLSTYNTDVYKVVKRRLRLNSEWVEPTDIIHKYLKARDWAVSGWGSLASRTSTNPLGYRWRDIKRKGVLDTFIPQGFIACTLPLATTIDQWLGNPPSNPPKGKTAREGAPFRPDIVPMSSEWEDLSFGMTSLTESASSFIGRRKRPSMTGKFPVRPDRLLTDPERRIFRETVRGEGGIVIFDCSGSMSVSMDDIKAILKHFAGATIMAYSYRGDDCANAWVLARNGRMVGEGDFRTLDLGNGNGVDSPALRWAIRQRKSPKDFIVWVSDGYVTGKGDYSNDELIKECALLSLKHNIIGVRDADEAVRLVADMKRGARPRNKFVRVIADALKSDNKIGEE